jgi:hypothetical protein
MTTQKTRENPDAMQVCLNGHLITAHYHEKPEERSDYCSDECGAATIYTCPRCEAEIPGGYYKEVPVPTVAMATGTSPRRSTVSVLESPKKVPPYCKKCGAPYPWTERQLRSEAEAAVARQPDALEAVERICRRFHTVARQLQHRHDDRNTLIIEDEYDTQDLLHALLRMFFDDVRSEEATPSYAGGASRMDFLLKKESLGMEVKKTRRSLTAKELGSQLIEDIARFKEHPNCKTLVCLVYDPADQLQNPQGLMDDLSGEREELNVRVLIVPRRH